MTLTHFTVQAPAPGYNGFASGAVVNADGVFREHFPRGGIAVATGETPPVGIVPAETPFKIINGVLCDASGSPGVRLKCDQAALGLSTTLQYEASFHNVDVAGDQSSIAGFTFNAQPTDTPLNLLTVTPVASVTAIGVISHDVEQYANLAAFPAVGDTGRVYVAKDTNFLYRWSGSAYIQVGGGAATEWEEYANLAAFPGTGDTAKEYVALDTGKIYRWNGSAYIEVSVGEPTITAGTTAQYWRGDKTFQTLNQDVVPDGTTNKAYSAADKTRLANTSGTNTGDQTSVSGNAGTATQLATPRNINGVAFDGTANITVNPPLASVGVTQLSATGTPSSSTYLRGDNTWSASAGGGGITRSVVTVTSSVTLGSAALTDYVTLIGAGGAPTLPTAVGNTNRYTCKNIDTTNKTVATTSSQTIDGSTTVSLTPDTSLDFISDGTNWRII